MYLPGRKLHWSVLGFLFIFVLVLLLVGWFYLIPAARAMENADPQQRVYLRDTSKLLLAVVLILLGSVLVLCFRIGQFFLPRPPTKRVRTNYVDAWAEAGKRMQIPDEDGESPNKN
jgi:hypothetical protein